MGPPEHDWDTRHRTANRATLQCSPSVELALADVLAVELIVHARAHTLSA
ncbi:hypothetical protein NLQ83_23395 [Escherichia coli]|nr:hypothetical protein [Escherichia coli]